VRSATPGNDKCWRRCGGRAHFHGRRPSSGGRHRGRFLNLGKQHPAGLRDLPVRNIHNCDHRNECCDPYVASATRVSISIFSLRRLPQVLRCGPAVSLGPRQVFCAPQCREPEETKHHDNRNKYGPDKQRPYVVPHGSTRFRLPRSQLGRAVAVPGWNSFTGGELRIKREHSSRSGQRCGHFFN
jgi:hypothetical protein